MTWYISWKNMDTLLKRDTLRFNLSPMSLMSLFKRILKWSHFTWVGFINEDWRELFSMSSACHSHPLVEQLLSCCWIAWKFFSFASKGNTVTQTCNIYNRFSNLPSLKYGIIWIVFSKHTWRLLKSLIPHNHLSLYFVSGRNKWYLG